MRARWKSFQTRAWYKAITGYLEYDIPFKLERSFQPQNIKRTVDGILYSTRAWDKYKTGARTPSDGSLKDKSLDLVSVVGKEIPDSEYVFRHPLWDVLGNDNLTESFILKCLSRLSNKVQSSYIDLTAYTSEEKLESFFNNIEHFPSIKISDEDNLHVSLEHLAVQILILKIPKYAFKNKYLTDAAENIAKTLGPISTSPWFKSFYEELFDFLEENYWKDMFDNNFPRATDIRSIKGWRKTKYFWIKPKYQKS